MSDHDQNKQFDDKNLTNHDYDGIKEYDNPLPNWWLMTFFGTIIFAFIYYIHYEVGGGPTLVQELAQEMEALKASQSAAQVATAAAEAKPGEDYPGDEAALTAAFANKEEAGKKNYDSRCASCHGDKGQGLVGPNLTDLAWKNGDGSRLAILNVIRKGVLEKGMPAWEAMMKPTEVIEVASYVFSIKGTKVPGGKAPEGKEYPTGNAQK